MENEYKIHVYKCLFRVGIILLLASFAIIILFLISLGNKALFLLYYTFFGLYFIFVIPLLIISVILIIISKINLKKIMESSDKNV